MSAIERLGTLGPWLPCPDCPGDNFHIVENIDGLIGRWLGGHAGPCSKCGTPLDCWRAVVNGIENHFSFGRALALAGCQTVVFNVEVPPMTTTVVDLTEHGLPPDAEIVGLNLTSQGGVRPLRLHSNEVLQPIGPKFGIFGRPLPDPGSNGNGVSVLAVWFVHRPDDAVIRHLVDAARQYDVARFDGVVVPANIAAEASLAPVLPRFYSRYGSRENVANMLEKNATYADQLNVLINVVSERVGVPRLRDDIRGVLNRLRGLRNKIAHEGRCKAQTRRDAAEHLAGAIFLAKYAAMLRAGLDAENTLGSSGATSE